MFQSLQTSWEFSQISYRLIWHHKRLLIFPLLSAIAELLILITFIVPLFVTSEVEIGEAVGETVFYIVLFLFYFVTNAIVLIFNTGLIACVIKILHGYNPSVGYGLSFAFKRLPQIVSWSVLSAVVSVILNILEKNENISAIVTSIIGVTWNAITYFVVPVIVMNAVGPIGAIKRSGEALRSTWGEALVGNFSLKVIGFLLFLPVIILLVIGLYIAIKADSVVGVAIVISLGIIAFIIDYLLTETANSVFKCYLYTYATDQEVLDESDSARFAEAFSPKQRR